ncbi:hypothetical protein SBA4_3010005 [Candidatus Sulfopaludibacter sp. SbA4]|nr:hypothetical protein SBA4_3010005 [Candidatus Sulfopaludibacter sp. SbA4]
MTGKTPRRAVDSFLAPLQRALSCFTDSVLQCKLPLAGLNGAAALPPQARIKATAEHLHLTAAVHFRVIELKRLARAARTTWRPKPTITPCSMPRRRESSRTTGTRMAM